jgi:hypothetical protein
MAIKGEIGWRRNTPEGGRLNVVAKRVGKQWRFVCQTTRFEKWEPMPDPPLEDWLLLLDAVERRVQRRKQMPDDLELVRRRLRERFPEHKLD